MLSIRRDNLFTDIVGHAVKTKSEDVLSSGGIVVLMVVSCPVLLGFLVLFSLTF